MIPRNITRENVIEAIKQIEKEGIPGRRGSDKYYLKYNDILYPSKYIVSLANRYANGKELDSSEFGGGAETNNFLTSLGFNTSTISEEISDKSEETDSPENDYAPHLKEYLESKYSIRIDKFRRS